MPRSSLDEVETTMTLLLHLDFVGYILSLSFVVVS
jgi:hypothetical protein